MCCQFNSGSDAIDEEGVAVAAAVWMGLLMMALRFSMRVMFSAVALPRGSVFHRELFLSHLVGF